MSAFSISRERERDLSQLRRRPTLETLLNVFTPTRAIDDPVRFAGRKEQVDVVATALITREAELLIFGERGSGKSSLALMLYAIATGNYQLLDYYGLREHLEKKGHIPIINLNAPWTTDRTTFNTVWVDGTRKSLDQVLHSALTRRADNRFGPGLLAYLPKEADQTEVISKIGFDKVFTGETSVKTVSVPAKPINIKDGFELATQQYSAAYPERELLIIVDEFDTVTDTSDMAPLMKTANARFALVGIASTIAELLPEHGSIARATHAVDLPPMTDEELAGIVTIGSYILAEYVSYTDAAIEAIARAAHGSPFWCQFLARGLLEAKIEIAGGWEAFVERRRRVQEITGDDVDALITALPNRADCRLYEESLRLTTMGDPVNEKVLGAIAQAREAINTTETVSRYLSRSGVDMADADATIKGFLGLPGSPLQEQGTVRSTVRFSFRDPNFKRYVLLRGLG
jgi:hypothetical protein